MKNRIVCSVFLLITFILSNSCGQSNNIQVVKPAKFQAMLQSDKSVVLLDVRTPEEHDSVTIANAVNIDFYADDFAAKLSKLDKNKTYLVYCRSGKRSNKTANMLTDQGFKNVFDLDGGIIAWKTAGLPVESKNTK